MSAGCSALWPLGYDARAVTEQHQKAVSPAPDSDAALVASARAGDATAFDALVLRYRNEVYGLCYRYTRHREDAWDAAQDVFIKAHQALGRFRGDSSFKTWVLRIAANHCKDRFKRRRLATVALEETHQQAAAPGRSTPDRAADARELGAAIDAAVDALSPKHRLTFILREYEGLSYEEMAEVMGCSLGTVMSRLHHARRKLQDSLIRMGYVEERRDG